MSRNKYNVFLKAGFLNSSGLAEVLFPEISFNESDARNYHVKLSCANDAINFFALSHCRAKHAAANCIADAPFGV